ncbi:hypothetical protein CMI37_03905 [Candidatus Pacearchaeota archaeon]|nr:hypothetical protein [Candidatus Pacearchaeota archaeon]
MKIKDYRKDDKYWKLHKEIYFDELDTLDFEIKNIIINNPHSGTAKRFNKNVEVLIAERLKESDNHIQ